MEGKAYSDEGKPCQSPGRMKHSSYYNYCPGRGSNARPSARRSFKHGQSVPRPYSNTNPSKKLTVPTIFGFHFWLLDYYSLGHGGCKGYEFSAICLQETWLSSDFDISLFKIHGYNLISQGKMCSSHGGLAIYISEKFNFSTIDLTINSLIWEGQFIEIANTESNKSLIIGNVYRPPSNINTLYQDFTNAFIPILEYLQRANCETIITGDVNIDLLKNYNNATLGNYFNSVVAQSFFPQITLATKFSDHNSTLIDNYLCKLKRIYLQSISGVLRSRIPDHLPYITFLIY